MNKEEDMPARKYKINTVTDIGVLTAVFNLTRDASIKSDATVANIAEELQTLTGRGESSAVILASAKKMRDAGLLKVKNHLPTRFSLTAKGKKDLGEINITMNAICDRLVTLS